MKIAVFIPFHIGNIPTFFRPIALAQSFTLMVREKKGSALEPWLQEASKSGIAELRTFATGIKRDQAAVQAVVLQEIN